ncbi:MAG: RNA-binding transcriptional accessory protein [Rikenellaceae bacterium]|nr:RNA-binding transcriptional accessory protein [Rikenellaceae bacterium]
MAREKIIGIIAAEVGVPARGVENVIKLLDDGATIPFISRYRKEATGALDEMQVGEIKLRYDKLTELMKRKDTILNTIEEQGKLTDELRQRIEECYDAAQLEDIYLPYRPKRRTKATIAREKGLEPLALRIMAQDGSDPEVIAAEFISDAVENEDAALAGACDIIAEIINESEQGRSVMRRLFNSEAIITSRVIKGKELVGVKYSDYFDSGELLRKAPSHRMLAMLRGEKEEILRLSVAPDQEKALELLRMLFIKGGSPSKPYIERALEDSYKRLLRPSMESETIAAARQKADTEAIAVFAENLRQLLLSAPLGQKRVLAIDPGYRTGCKVVCLDERGTLLGGATIYPHTASNGYTESAKVLQQLVAQHSIEAVAVGDGTAGRETLQLVKSLFPGGEVQIFSVSEDGASVYSASAAAREEFPDQDVTVRGAISIGRRLIDPLAELVKIDPKAIGVGQYQHDVDQGELKSSLDTVVESCVNRVGVNLNTASKALLSYVSGLGNSLANNIVEYRAVNGSFDSRSSLLKVPRLGAKAFEQCAGFLRIEGASNPLDNSAVHPESYPIVERMASDLGVTVAELLRNKELRRQIDVKRYVTDSVGLPTLGDIMSELEKPGRDPREQLKAFEFSDSVHTIDDLREGMVLPGIVTNITNFGAFVDIGVKQDGLVHISQLAKKFVSNPNDIVKLHQHVTVKVTQIDHARNRIGLSMKDV